MSLPWDHLQSTVTSVLLIIPGIFPAFQAALFSGGSAALIAAKEATLSLGGDTGGSIRCPSSFCGVTGIKTTYGLVSRYGMVSYANSLEQIGPIGKNVRDCALLLEVIAGYDPRDSTSVKDKTKQYTKDFGVATLINSKLAYRKNSSRKE